MKLRIRIATMLLLLCGPLTAGALYDPAPDAALAASEGAWTGALTYKDSQKPALSRESDFLSSNFSTLPDAFIGSAGNTSTKRGTL